MLPKIYFDTDSDCAVRISKFAGNTDVSDLGALPWGTVLNIELTVSRRVGASGAVMRLNRDGGKDVDLPLDFCRSDNLSDVYSCTLDTAKLCGDEGSGLFYYEFLLLRGFETLFTDSYNNLDFTLAEREGARFRLLVYEKDYTTPKGFGRGVMYQIFTDRFFRGESEQARAIKVKDGAILNEDWESGIPQYAPYPGAPLKNNMFFGGNLWGVAEKLDYLASLGVTCIYLCPIFEAYSNHKYDTANYEHVDAMFGGDEALDNLISKAREKGIGIILDGVFNHTGDDSLYFDRYSNFGGKGAYSDPESPYRDWFCFREYPEKYECWWGIDILPKLNHESEDCRRYFTGEDGIIRKYIDRGIVGWRLDVADELADEFLDELRASAKEASDGEAVIIGEVWENAADKMAYGKRRRYFRGKQLDSVMNYPLKNAIVSFCLWGDGETLYNTLTELYSSYPPFVCHKLMNIIGTHDTERILTVLGRDDEGEELDNAAKSVARLSKKERERGVKLLKLASVLQFTSFGIPSVYYGDEVGLEGYGDPFCRMPFPWHELEEKTRSDLLAHYRALGRIRMEEEALDGGSFYTVSHSESGIVFVREKGSSRLIVAANRGEAFDFPIPEGAIYLDLISGRHYERAVTVRADTAMILKEITL
ncbi:MAG: glycoside hydrolase family 13 protein [Clostridia bacterium]|nr:glycoside hydrolase family 13 protein [Clostridia bacterium]